MVADDGRWEDADYSLRQDLFDDLSKDFGPFDIDAAASPFNHKCPHYITKEQDVLASNLKHLNTYLNMWYDESGTHQYEVITRWLSQHQESPSDTHICIVVPKWTTGPHTRWFQLLKERFSLVREYPKGTSVFLAPDYSVNDSTKRPYIDLSLIHI